MKTVKSALGSEKPSQSTLLFGSYLMETVLTPRSLKGKRLAMYLHKLLSDPELDYKLSHLKAKKWKKQYQDNGQDLVPVYFFPDECDWARLSIISNATGFSRCYIFVYLMLLDVGILKLPKKNITTGISCLNIKISQISCTVILNEKEKKLRRILKSQPNPSFRNPLRTVCGCHTPSEV